MPGMLLHVWHPSTQEGEAGGSKIHGQLGVHSKLSATMDYIMRPCHKKESSPPKRLINLWCYIVSFFENRFWLSCLIMPQIVVLFLILIVWLWIPKFPQKKTLKDCEIQLFRICHIDQCEQISFFELRNQHFSSISPVVILPKNNLMQCRESSSEDPAKVGFFLSS
jgi:hypothetical protein